jgi:hypothetical protein
MIFPSPHSHALQVTAYNNELIDCDTIGIDARPLQDGDIVNLDISVFYNVDRLYVHIGGI